MNTDSQKVSPRSSHVALALVALVASCAQPDSDASQRELAQYIAEIKAIDVHAHPLRFVAAGAPADSEYDALPLDGIPPFPIPVGLRPENPHFRAAQRALYAVSETDTGATYAKALSDARAKVKTEHAARFGEWALDAAGIDIMLANRIVMGDGLPAARFKWVPFADPLMLPHDTKSEAARTPDMRALYPLEDKLLKRYLRDLGLAKVPATLDAFEKDVVTATLERQKAAGAVGIKFEAAYLRSLDFGAADPGAARSIYARYAGGGTPSHEEYRTLEDHLFRVISREAGRLHLTVQIHSAEGFGGYYSADGAAPHHLESAFNDSTLRNTNFVIVHGGWPRVRETLALLGKPNVYTDVSMISLLASRQELSAALRLWLNDAPEKVLFASDAFDGGDAEGWEQVAWAGARNARAGLSRALSEMVHDGEITLDRAKQLAQMVMRENALKAYTLK